VLTSDEDTDGCGRTSGAERRVGRARVERLVGRYHRAQDQSAVLVHLGVLGRLEVQHTPVLRPDDDRARRVGLDRTVDPSHQTARQVDTLRHREHAGQI